MGRTAALCVFGLVALGGARARAFCIEQPSYDGQTWYTVTWAAMPVTFRIHDTGSGTMDKAAELDAVRAAFAEWAAAPCASISFQEGGLIPASEQVNISHMAHEIRVYWAHDTTEWGSTNTTSVAKTWFNFDVTGVIVSGGMVLNAIDKAWSAAAGGETGKYDVQSVVATEIGRLLGMASSHDASAVMYPSFIQATVDKRTLAADDIAAASYLYPAAAADGGACEPPIPDPTCTVSPPQDDGGVVPDDDGGTVADGSAVTDAAGEASAMIDGGGDGGTVTDGGGTADGGGAVIDAADEGGAVTDAGDDGGIVIPPSDGGGSADGDDGDSGTCGTDGRCMPARDRSGCGCRGAGGGDQPGLVALGLALGLGLAARRRGARRSRRRRARRRELTASPRSGEAGA